ncbi:MAG: protein kinase [Planctomycetota bacterium]
MSTPRITGYELLGTLSEGRAHGSTLYKAWQTNLKRYVALRVLDEEEADDLDYLKRFRDEAHRAMDIRQRNVVSTLDQGTCPESGLHYVAYEFVKGPNLEKILQGVGSLSEDEAVALAHGVSMALCSLERASLVHGQVGPHNVLLNEDGVPKLAEVGLARHRAGLGSPHLEHGPQFISPEQALGLATLDTRADLFALGVTLYRLVTGTYPFQGEEAFEVVTQNINVELPDPRDTKPDLNQGLADVLQGLSARDPDERYLSAEAASFDLARLRSGLDVLGPEAAKLAVASGQVPPSLSESKVLKVLLSESAARRQLRQSNGSLKVGSADDPPSPFKVRVFTKDVRLSERRFDQDVVVIGRAVNCDVQIDNPTVSRKHVEIRRRGGTFALVAHRTTNGTTVNGTPVRDATALRLDERIVVSDKFRIEIEVEPAESRDPPETSRKRDPDRTPSPEEPQNGQSDEEEPDVLQSLSEAVERERGGTSRTAAPLGDFEDTPVRGTPTTPPAHDPLDPPTEQQIVRPRAPEPEPEPTPVATEEFEVPAFGRRGSGRTGARDTRRTSRNDLAAIGPRAYLSGSVDGVDTRVAVDKILQVGKAEGCAFRLPGSFAPRKAALIVPFGGAFQLINVAPAPDAVLRNGSPVDDMVALQSGDVIEIGVLRLTFELS